MPLPDPSPRVPFNDTSRVFLAHEGRLRDAIQDALQGGRWLFGTHTERFSREFADFCGTQYCLPVANGTDALELALRALIPPDDGQVREVITVANAGGYTTTACRLVGAVPVYADINESDQLVNSESLLRCLGPDVAAVTVTHLYGGVVDVVRIRDQMQALGFGHIPIIEDCSQAHGARLVDRRVGSMGDLGVFSFYPTKNLGAMGDAGAIVTSNGSLFEKLRATSQYGWARKYHVQLPYGRNSRMDEVQAAVLSSLLPYLDEYNTIRRGFYERYTSCVGGGLRPLVYSRGEQVAHLAVLRAEDRGGFVRFMAEQGVATDMHYPVLDCDQEGWRNLPMRLDPESNLEISRRAVTEIVSIPCFPLLEDAELTHICSALESWEKR